MDGSYRPLESFTHSARRNKNDITNFCFIFDFHYLFYRKPYHKSLSFVVMYVLIFDFFTSHRRPTTSSPIRPRRPRTLLPVTRIIVSFLCPRRRCTAPCHHLRRWRWSRRPACPRCLRRLIHATRYPRSRCASCPRRGCSNRSAWRW